MPYRYDIRKFIYVSCFIAIVTYIAATNTPFLGEYGFLITPTAIVGATTLFWVQFNKVMWRWRFFHFVGLSELPDLNGDWVGWVDRIGENNPHRFEAKIIQTYTTISLITKTRSSVGRTISAHFLTDETKQHFEILNHWDCATHRKGSTDTIENFVGLSRLRVCRDGDRVWLEDYYFTNRNPATEGRLVLARKEDVLGDEATKPDRVTA